MIRILLADDLTVIRKGMRHILSQAWPTAQIEELEEGQEGLGRCSCCRWDIIISHLPGRDRCGGHSLDQIRHAFPAVPLLILSRYGRESDEFRALPGGAMAGLRRDAARDELLWAVRQIVAGKKYIASVRDN